VYSATDQVLQRRVAIKVLKEQSGKDVGKRLRLEAQIAARLLHDNVVRIYDPAHPNSRIQERAPCPSADHPIVRSDPVAIGP
jgi:serine/threonine protein kinase